MSIERQIRVCVGNYGYYGEGRLRDEWIALPKSDEEIAAFLRDNGLKDPLHEETYISDYDGTPLGIGGGQLFSEYTPLEDLNLLAHQLAAASEGDLEAVRGALDAGGYEPQTVEELMNLIDQADRIGFVAWPDAHEWSGPEERLARAWVDAAGGPGALPDSVLERCLDYSSYGRHLLECGFVAGEEGYLDEFGGEVLQGRYDMRDVVEAASRLGWKDPLPSPESTGECRRALAAAGLRADGAPDAGNATLLSAVAFIVDGLEPERARALALYADAYLPPSASLSELGNAALQADEIYYYPYDNAGGDRAAQLASSYVSRLGGVGKLPADELESHFDYRAFGEEIGQWHSCGRFGYLADGGGIDLRRITKQDFEARYMPERAAARPDAPQPSPDAPSPGAPTLPDRGKTPSNALRNAAKAASAPCAGARAETLGNAR